MRIEVDLNGQIVEEVERWRLLNSTTRADAMRRLIERGLQTDQFAPSKVESLILYLLCNPPTVSEATFITQAIGGGHFWAVEDMYGTRLADRADSTAEVTFVHDVLGMFRELKFTIGKLPAEDALMLNDKYYTSFRGFDGNNEARLMNIAHFIIHNQEYEEFQGRLNSHQEMAECYERMLEQYKRVKADKPAGAWRITFDEIVSIFSAATHPDNR
jgi:hypothetical protein